MTKYAAEEAWVLMSDLVLDAERRREVADAVGMTFGRARTLRRLARTPMTMRELADKLGIDPPNLTPVVKDLEQQGLVRRTPHPTDGRVKIVEVTAKGRKIADRATAILATPPAQLRGLSDEDLRQLTAILSRASGR